MTEIKKDTDWDCRALPNTFLSRFLSDDETKSESTIGLKAFVDLVKKHNELAFCLRGNDYSKGKPLSGGKVCIYRNNHAMFTLKPQSLQINPNYLRYCKDWQKKLDILINEYGFCEGNAPQLGNVVHSYSCSFEKSWMSVPYSRELINKLDSLYSLMTAIFDDFFSNDQRIDCFLAWGNENDSEYKGIIPSDYINHHKKCKLEKIRQQQLYATIKEQKNGYFFYDMEFQQKHKSKDDQQADKEKGLSNKPDMQAIRFDENGLPVAWVFVEVKCTRAAYTGASGLIEHMNKMQKYLENESNFNRRKREAFLLLNQYEQLGLMKLDRKLEWNEYEKLKKEVLLVFTDDAIKLWSNDENQMVKELRNEQKNHLGEKVQLSDKTEALLIRVSKE